MNFLDLLKETYLALSMNKVRSGLTILGIIIGIGSVVAMISIGRGAQLSIEQRIQAIGSNLLMVYPGSQQRGGFRISSGRGSAKTLTLDDADAIGKGVSSANSVAPEVSGKYQVVAKGTNTNTTVTGTVSSYTKVKNLEISSGVFISEQDVKVLAKVAVLGPNTKDDLFGENVDPVGQKIRISSVDFTIIGVTKAKGSSGFGSQDDIVFIPISTAQRYLSGNKYVNVINIQVQDENLMSVTQDEITSLLLYRHNISDSQNADFYVMNQADVLATMTEVTNTFTIFLAAIAGISLIVGGIGIMNMMLTTVTERTREIGLRKAIGAKSKDISQQFLIEAIMLTFTGGIIGVILGWLMSLCISSFMSTNTSVSIQSVILAVGVSGIIGIAFGYYPAKRAANLNPIEALRYE